MSVYLDTKAFELLLVGNGTFLTVKSGEYYRTHEKTVASEGIDKTEYIHVIGYAQISSYFIFFNVSGIDNNNYLNVFL